MDYYSILGVSKNASEQDIRKAYKKQSMKHHPDRGGDEEQFKKINEAYQTLSNPRKRAEYDNPQPQFNFNSNHFHSGNPFEDMFGGMHRRQRRNADVNIVVKLDLKDVLLGKQLTARYQVPSGKIKEANIDVPPGVDHNTGIRFRGLGDDILPGPAGDLIVRVKVYNTPGWQRSNYDLRTSATTTVFDCFLGSEVEIRTLDDKRLKINIPKGTQPGAVFSIPNYGLIDQRTGKK